MRWLPGKRGCAGVQGSSFVPPSLLHEDLCLPETLKGLILWRVCTPWRGAVQIDSPETVVRWHRRGFALYWRWKSRPRGVGRPVLSADLHALIRTMHVAKLEQSKVWIVGGEDDLPIAA